MSPNDLTEQATLSTAIMRGTTSDSRTCLLTGGEQSSQCSKRFSRAASAPNMPVSRVPMNFLHLHDSRSTRMTPMSLNSFVVLRLYSALPLPIRFPLPFSPLEDHIDQAQPQWLVHIVQDDDASVHDKNPSATPKGIAIARYSGATSDSPDIIRSFDQIELLLNYASEDLPGNSFILRGPNSLETKDQGVRETCQTPFWHAKSLDQFLSGGWHVRLFTLSSSSDDTTTSTKTPGCKNVDNIE